MDDLRKASKNDLVRMIKRLGQHLREGEQKNKTLLWVNGALVARCGGEVRIGTKEMQDILVSKRLQSHTDPETDELVVQLVDRDDPTPPRTPPEPVAMLCHQCGLPLGDCRGHVVAS